MLRDKLAGAAFKLGVVAKLIIGAGEFLAGVVFIIFGRMTIGDLISFFSDAETFGWLGALMSGLFSESAVNYAKDSHIFAIIYLFFHGLVNLFLAGALIKNKFWAYPWAIAAFSVFLIYQAYRYSYTHSPLLLLATLFDAFVVVAVFLEYKKRAKQKNF